jgi:serine/threonine-protein kinase
MTDAEQISELLLQWEELRDQGREPSAQDLCRACPELVPEVERRIQVLQAMDRVPNGARNTSTLPLSPSSPTQEIHPQLDHYEILEPLGSGGMGKVYKARQVALKRLVALKMVLAGYHATRQELERFRAEAEAVAALQHPHIVQIYEIGEKDGCPYLALEYVDGGSLDQHLKRRPLPALQAARLVRTLAQAIHHAHQHNIVHRDLKPGNVLLTANGTPKVADFGLAKRLDEARGRTQTGSVMGTPAYMAPEQAEGRLRQVGPATDVYSLGAILYECLTGRPPFEAPSLLETLEQVRSEAPRPPRQLQPGLPPDLETICLKCLEKDPGLRYPSAQALADDLTRFLDGEQIQARNPTLVDRLARTLNRVKVMPDLRPAMRVLLVMVPVPFLTQLVTFLLAYGRPFYPHAALAVMIGTMVTVFVIYWLGSGEGIRVALTATTRHLWSVRLSVLFGLIALAAVHYGLTPPGTEWNPLGVFPLWVSLAGAAFFGLGGIYWGRLYLLGLFMLGIAVLMPLRLEWAPLGFGLLMSITLAVLLWGVWKINRQRDQLEGTEPDGR